MTTVILVIIGILAVGLGVWSWWFENGSVRQEDLASSDHGNMQENGEGQEK